MAMQRWEPMSELDTMRRQMDRMINQVFGRSPMGMLRGESMQAMMPTVEVYMTEHDVIVNAELPGIDPKEVNVEISEDSIILTGEMKQEKEIQEDAYYSSERSFGQFRRIIPLPAPIKDQEAKASFKNGLLTLRMPLAEAPKKKSPRKIPIDTK